MSKDFEELVLKELKELKKDNAIILKKFEEQKEFNKQVLKRFDSLEKRVTTIEKDAKDFRKEVANRFDTLERTVTIIEDEVKNKIPALFESDLTRRQKESSLQSEIDHLR